MVGYSEQTVLISLVENLKLVSFIRFLLYYDYDKERTIVMSVFVRPIYLSVDWIGYRRHRIYTVVFALCDNTA